MRLLCAKKISQNFIYVDQIQLGVAYTTPKLNLHHMHAFWVRYVFSQRGILLNCIFFPSANLSAIPISKHRLKYFSGKWFFFFVCLCQEGLSRLVLSNKAISAYREGFGTEQLLSDEEY